ncbi:hypothetical protein [uncultured Clostridium sp.]|nr:hypothetical protein [uncultured Clostridium sp.]
MNHKYYLRVENGDFSFISNEIHEIRSTDIEITKVFLNYKHKESHFD